MAIKFDPSNQSIGNSVRSNQSKGPLQANLERLSSGKRINSAQHDAARLAIAMRFTSQIQGSQQAYRNVNDGVSMAQTGEGAVQELSSNVQRIRELAVQSANAGLNNNDRAALQQEVAALQEEITRSTGNTQFNGVSLLDNATSFEFQVGANAGDTVVINSQDVANQLDTAGVSAIDISTAAGAGSAIAVADSALEVLSQSQAEFGAAVNRFETAARNLLNLEENLQASRSRIEDADYAQQSAELTRNLILQQSENAMRGQANLNQQNVLQLLG